LKYEGSGFKISKERENWQSVSVMEVKGREKASYVPFGRCEITKDIIITVGHIQLYILFFFFFFFFFFNKLSNLYDKIKNLHLSSHVQYSTI
jgi:hypothetical protein